MTESEKHKTKEKYARLQTRAFSIVLEVILIFGGPVVIVMLLSHFLSLSKNITFILLGATFILSWVVLLKRIKDMNNRLEEMRKKLHRSDL